ncbi:MAG: MFS transporter [Thermoprotei archaeon]|nr:MFS transporter [TACK group archaeon]
MKSDIPSILSARVVYAMQWYFLAPVTIVIAQAMGMQLSQIGLLPVSFIVGAAAAQIPAGLLSSKFSPKWVYVAGLGLLSGADLAASVSTTETTLLSARLAAGFGAGLFFSPAAAVLVRARESRAGLVMGAYNAAFNVGGMLGLAWGIPETALGWRAGMALGGLIGLALAVENAMVGKREVPKGSGAVELTTPVLVLGISTAGFWGSNYAAGTLLASYAQLAYGATPAYAGLLTSVFFVGSIAGGLFGHSFDKVRRKWAFMFGLMVGTSATFAAIGLGATVMVIAMLANGLLSGLAFTSYYAFTSSISKNFSLALATVNFLNMVIGVWVSSLFGWAMSVSVRDAPFALIGASILPLSLWLLPRKFREPAVRRGPANQKKT